ncbi:apelin receptor early endogenous ligand [Carettochelys insculpta]|uniref:apelin receptor early endogenous ligand n=1 Tax=Carettochelys insculpta TaxID=44489 RepID=UPI003EBB65BD
MRFQQLLYVLLFLSLSLLLVKGQRPALPALRRKLHRHSCSQRRCLPLHSRVPFP